MELELTADQKLFQETTERFLIDTCPLDEVRALENDADGFDPAWWQQACALGWTSMLAPESLGGGSISGFGLRDLTLAAYERGRLVSPGPFAPTNAAIAALAASPSVSSHTDLIGRLIDGSAIAAVALDEPGGAWASADIETMATTAGDGLVVNGTKVPVEAAPTAHSFIVSARRDDGVLVLVLVAADAPGVTVTPRATVDLVRRYGTLQLQDVAVPLQDVLAEGAAAIDACVDVACVLQLAESVGALERVFEFTLEWAFDRHTFGRPLASYQELKHRFADMKLWLEAAKATTSAAAKAVAENAENASELVSTAKSYVNDHGPELVQDCVQMHGGIGVTWDHDIHLYLRRVTLNAATYGTRRAHRERIASMILEGV